MGAEIPRSLPRAGPAFLSDGCFFIRDIRGET